MYIALATSWKNDDEPGDVDIHMGTAKTAQDATLEVYRNALDSVYGKDDVAMSNINTATLDRLVDYCERCGLYVDVKKTVWADDRP